MWRNDPAAAGIAFYIVLFGVALGLTLRGANASEFRGHIKGQVTATDFPDDSLFTDFSDDPAQDTNFELRINLGDSAGGWRWQGAYQMLSRRGDQLELERRNLGLGAMVDDQNRVFDLTHRISDEDDRVLLHRADRLLLSHSTDKTVLKLGRQAVSWGNGLIYNPVDFFNPFNPAAIDTEYKTGDDMVYAQYLFASGDDLQAVWVGRRDDDDDVSAEVASLAVKYHGFADGGEFDLLVAEHFDARILAVGGIFDVAETIWRSDIIVTEIDGQSFTGVVLNWSNSWIAWSKNLNATIEYYRNGFGIDDGDYAPAALATQPELSARLTRGELFTLAENYLAATVTIELHPLWLMTSTLFANLDDDSELLQVLSQHDLAQNLQLYVALNLPAGNDGSEFGGIDSGIAARPLATDASLFAQLAWYF